MNLLTLDEVAKKFRVSRRTMQEYIKLHPYYRVLGRRKLFGEADISRLFEALGRPAVMRRSTKRRIPSITSEETLSELRNLLKIRSE